MNHYEMVVEFIKHKGKCLSSDKLQCKEGQCYYYSTGGCGVLIMMCAKLKKPNDNYNAILFRYEEALKEAQDNPQECFKYLL